MNNRNLQDIALRTLIFIAGAVSAALLILKGQPLAVPALAAGATLGVMIMTTTADSTGE
jgi:hypothetical protein